jgi:transposase
MSKTKSSVAGLAALYVRVCGMDVHKNSVVACVRILNAKDSTVQSTLRKFGTMTADLVELRQWLAEQQVTHAAMESIGVYWQPVFNVLEGHLEVWVVNAQHIKKVPGRKTDMKDAEWIAQLMQCGLLKPSFVPDRQQRELRDLTRQQTKLVQQRNAVDNRIQKVLETANIKLGSVASDVLGVSGRKTQACWRSWPTRGCARRFLNCSAPWRERSPTITAFCCASCSTSTTFWKRRSRA